MDVKSTASPYGRGLFVTLTFAVLGAAILFGFLMIVTGAYVLAFLAALVLIGVVASLHYLVWGKAMKSHVPVVYSRPRLETAEAEVPDHFNLPLDERERSELLAHLDRCLAQPEETAESRAVLLGIRDRLDRYGA